MPIFWLLCHKYLCQWGGGNWNLQDVINFSVFFWGLPLLIGFVWDSFVDSDAFWWSQAQWLDNEYEGYRLVTATHLSAPKEEKHVNTDWYIIDTIKPQLHSTHESKMTYAMRAFILANLHWNSFISGIFIWHGGEHTILWLYHHHHWRNLFIILLRTAR